MKITLIALSILLISSKSFPQGSWDIGYIKIDSVQTSDIGRMVKLDFRHHWPDNHIPNSRWIRTFVTPEDTARLKTCDVETIIVERRKIYVDHGSFYDQYLELESENENLSKRIYDTKLIAIEDRKLKFTLTVETFEMKKTKRGNKLKTENCEVWVDRKELDGLLIAF